MRKKRPLRKDLRGSTIPHLTVQYLVVQPFAILAMAVLPLAVSCRYKDLCYDHSHAVDVRVVFNWEKAPDADPESMSLYLFPESGGKYLRYEFTDCLGGMVRVPVGDYDALCLNSDTENITYKKTETAKSFVVTTRSADDATAMASLGLKSASFPRASGTESESLVLAPDFLWSDDLEGVRLESDEAVRTIELFPEQSVCRYRVEILNVRNIRHAIAFSGSLSGMSAGWLPGKSSLSDELVTIPFNLDADRDEAKLSTSFLTFGHHPRVSGDHKLVVYAILSDLSKWYYTFDVTDQVRAAPDPKDVLIVLNGLDLPKPLVNGGGFQPSVDDWKSVVVEIKM